MLIGDIVWKTKFNKNFDCFVERTSQSTGQLKLIDLEKNTLLIDQEVQLTDNAELAPDYEDILLWQEICQNLFDK